MAVTHTDRPLALISGASRGIGRAIALELARDGHDVSFCYGSRDDAAREVQEELESLGARVLARRTDVADLESVRALVAETMAGFGRLDAVITAAGIIRDSPLVLMADEDWREVIRVNLDGTYALCRAAVFEMMKRRSGVILTVSSVAGVCGNPTQTNYSASKAGIIGFTQALAKEVAHYGIRVNALAPGFIETDMTAALEGEARKKALDRIPLGRMGAPDDVSALVGFLVSERASYITGAVLPVDGGIVI